MNAMASCLAMKPEPPPPHGSGASSGFDEALRSTKSSGPPGPEPPATGKKVVGEGAKKGPIARSRNQDLPSKKPITAKSDEDASLNSKPDDSPKAPDVNLGDANLLAMLSASAAIPAVDPQQDLALDPFTGWKGDQDSVTRRFGTKFCSDPVADPSGTAIDAIPDLPSAVAAPDPTPEVRVYPGLSDVGPQQASQPTVDSLLGSTPSTTATKPQDALQPVVAASPAQTANPATPIADQDPTVTANVQQTSVSAVVSTEPKKPGTQGAELPKVGAKNPAKANLPKDAAVLGTSIEKDQSPVVEAKSTDLEVDALPSATVKLAEGQGAIAAQPQNDIGVQTPVADSGPLKGSDLNLVVRQITDKLELLAATQPKNGVTIQLQPEHLGSITMTVKSMAGAVQAHISASDDNVRTALEQNRPLLGQAIAERGLKLDSVSIAAQTQSSTSGNHQATAQQQQQQQQQQSQQTRAHSQQSVFSDRQSVNSVAMHQARQTTRSAQGVDLWI